MSWQDWALAATVLLALAAVAIWRQRVMVAAAEFGGFLKATRGEIEKITWPTRDDLRKATLVILGFVILVSLVIGAMDVVLQEILVKLPSGGGL